MTYELCADAPYELQACARLSLERVTGRREPRTPTNEQRIKTFRRYAEPPKYNERVWAFPKSKFNPDPPSAEDVRQAFQFKHGDLT